VKAPTGFTARFDNPTDAVREHGTYGGRRQSRWLRTADGFAVCGLRATDARYLEICKRRWVDRPVGVDQDTRASSLADFLQLRRLVGPLASLFLMCEGSRYRSGRSAHWVKVKNSESARCHARGGGGIGAVNPRGSVNPLLESAETAIALHLVLQLEWSPFLPQPSVLAPKARRSES
jgi:hypothetical protein